MWFSPISGCIIPPVPIVSCWYACIGSNPERTTMLPGILLGSGNCTFKLGILPLLASAGALPFTPLFSGIRNPRMIVPSGLPPSILCTCPVSSLTVMLWNCISSFGMFNTLPILYGCLRISSGCANSCACSIGIIALFVVSKENLTLPYIFSPVWYAVLLFTRVIHGTAPRPRALIAGILRLPPSILFHTMFSTEKFFAAES